ncbi:MAG: benzoate-CoA ligase family protein [Chloroflexi bacterium]|nr:MAG: benzoate-CoA ligase family protein [Chloroflexota bacterium]
MRASDLPLHYNAVEILEHNLVDRADKKALLTLDREMTFREVSNEVNQVGNALRKLGVRFGDVVGILAPDSAEWVTAYFGVMKIGAVALGMNTLMKPYEYDYILQDSRARVLIVHESLLPAIDEVRKKHTTLEHTIVIGDIGERTDVHSFRMLIGGEATTLKAAYTHREDICMLNYSSGTTGEPKGIPHAHKDLPLTAQLWGVNTLGLQESDRTFALAKLFFTFGTGGNLLFPWYAGASIVLYAGSPRVTDNILAHIDRFKPTVFYNAPTGYAIMLSIADFTDRYDISSLRLCVSAGEALPAPVWQQWKERTGIEIIDGIGCTEVFHIFISNRPGDIRPGSSGKPVEGFEARIVDDDMNDVPQGEIGNLLIKGETTALSYLHQYDRSRRTFLGEWLFTGDKYFVDEDGYYWHAGRSDDMLKVGGIWVSPMEVESTLISHPAVVECAVVGHEDQSDLVKPKAFVILQDGYEASAELEQELIAYCREKLADYKRPRWVQFVDELPKTATGKIQRFRLREM